MTFDLNYSFNVHSGSNARSDLKKIGNFKWELKWSLEDSNRKLSICAHPLWNIIRPDVEWKVELDVRGKVGSTSFTKKNAKLLGRCENRKRKTFDEVIYMDNEETILKKLKHSEKTASVSLEVSNIRTTCLRKFPKIDYIYKNCGASDSIIKIKNKTIHSYSQILSLNSTVFKRMFEKETPPYVISLEDSIVHEDFLELLHHIYHPAEVIDEKNLRKILPLARQFEAPPILEMCQTFIQKHLACPSVDMNSKIEHFLLTWKYDLEPLKMSCYGDLFPCRDQELLSLFEHGIYEIMDEKQKAGMLQYVVLRSRGTLVSK